MLEILSQDRIESFVVINYETLVRNQAQTATELSQFIQGECDFTNDSSQLFSKRKRHLELHIASLHALEYMVEAKTINKYNKCKRNSECNKLMNDTKFILSELGYKWNPEVPYEQTKNDTMLLFTSNDPPPHELVERMKETLASGTT